MNRRGFMGSILAAAVAPAIVRADSLMRIVPRETVLLTHEMIAMEFAAWQSMKMRAVELLINPPVRIARLEARCREVPPLHACAAVSASRVDTIGNSFASCPWARNSSLMPKRLQLPSPGRRTLGAFFHHG